MKPDLDTRVLENRGPVFQPEHMKKLQQEENFGFRGYILCLNKGIEFGGRTYDLDIGHVLVAKARGFDDNQQNDDVDVAYACTRLGNVSRIPFRVEPVIEQNTPSYQSMSFLLLQSERRVDMFIYISPKAVYVFRAHGMAQPFYIMEPGMLVTKIDEPVMAKVEEARMAVKESGIRLLY